MFDTEDSMKIFAINSSPRKQRGNTERIVKPFLEGAQEAGASVETVYLQGMKIKPCLGCYKCWLDTPGVCVQKDDVAGLHERMRGADVIVYATPLYVFGMSAQMKLLFDRIMPEALPFIEVHDGHTTHPSRHGKGPSGMVLISNCGFHELANFDQLVDHFKIIAHHTRAKFIGALLRPEGEFLEYAEKLMPDAVNAVYAAARQAGRQLVTQGSFDEETLKAVSRQLLPLDVFIKGANEYFAQMIEKNAKKRAHA